MKSSSHTTSSTATRFSNLVRRSGSDKWLLCQTFVLLGLCRLAINLFSFKRLERFLGSRLTESPTKITQDQLLLAKKTHWAIKSIGPFTPWNSNCFPQALCAKILLRREGISSTLYMGATFQPDSNELEGHAWLRCGPLYVTGGDSSDKYSAIVSFA